MHNLDIEKEEQEEALKLKQESTNILNQVIKSAERKLQPKVLTDSMAYSPQIPDIGEDKKQGIQNKDIDTKKFKESKKENQLDPDCPAKEIKNKKDSDDTFELSQSIYLSPSQLQEAIGVVFCNSRSKKKQ